MYGASPGQGNIFSRMFDTLWNCLSVGHVGVTCFNQASRVCSTNYEARGMSLNEWLSEVLGESEFWDNYQMRLGMLWVCIRSEIITYTLKEYYLHLHMLRPDEGVFWVIVWIISHWLVPWGSSWIHSRFLLPSIIKRGTLIERGLASCVRTYPLS